MIDMKEKGMSRGEFDNVCRAVGGWAKLVDENAKDKDTLALLKWLDESQQADKLFENQQLFRQPIVRNGRQATVGYCPRCGRSGSKTDSSPLSAGAQGPDGFAHPPLTNPPHCGTL